MQSSHSDYGQAGYSQQYGYPPMQSVQSNAGHDMNKQVPAGQPGMYSNSGGMQSAPQHHHQPGMAGPAPSPQPQSLVQQGQQMNRTHMSIPNYFARNGVPRTVQNMGRNPMPSVVNQQPQQASSQFSHTVQMVQPHSIHPMAPIIVNSPITAAQMYQQRQFTPTQYSLINPNHHQNYFYGGFMSNFNNAPPPSANGYYPSHQIPSYNTMPSQMPQMPTAAQSQQQPAKKRLPIIDPNTGKNILEGVNDDTGPPKENENSDPNICVQFATQVAAALASGKNEPSVKASPIEDPRIVQPPVLCPGDLETENIDSPDTNNVGEICEQYNVDTQSIPGTNESLSFYKKDSDLSIINDAYESKILPEPIEIVPDLEIQDSKVYDVMPEEIPCEEDTKTDNLLPQEEEIMVEKPISYYEMHGAVQPSVPLVTEILTNKATPDAVPLVSESNLIVEDSKIKSTNSGDLEPAVSSIKLQEKPPPSESKKNKTKKKKDLNKRGESKEGGDMDAFLDRSEDASSKMSPAPILPPAAAPVTPVPPPVEQRTPSPIPTIMDSEILSTIPLPGETVEPLPNDISPSELSQSEVVAPVSSSIEIEDKENMSEDQSKIVLKYTYKEDQWSPLNPEGKKQYDRDFLLQLQSQPMSLCKPTNLPNLDVIKDKAHIQRLTEVNRAIPMPAAVRAFDPFMPNYARGGTPRPPHPAINRRSQQGRGGDKKTQKIIVLPSTHNIKLHESENAWKPSYKVDLSTDSAETQELYRKVRGILNKLTPQKFETLVEQVKNFDINTEEKLNGVIDLVFEKAIDEPNFSVPYANMCKQLALIKVPLGGQPGQQVNFRKLLLTKCQKEFEQDRCDELKREDRLKAIEAAEPDKKKELKLEYDEEEKKMRYRQLGNIRFIGELFKLNMLIEPIMHECINKLLTQGDEESLECLCKLLKTIGKELDEKGSKAQQGSSSLMDQYFAQMQKIVERRLTSSRVRFMLQDVIDVKRNNWIPRRDENNPKTIDQIHKEAEKEAREQQQVYQNMSSYPKRVPDDRRKTSGRNTGVSEDGWIPSTKSNKGSYSMVDPSKLKLTKPDEVESIRLGPGGRGLQSWGRGSSGGNKTSQDSDVKTALTNRYSALAEQPLAPTFENRRGSQRSAASSRESSRGRNSQLPPTIRKTPSTSRERENLIETVKELNRTGTTETKPQEMKRNNESQLNGKTVDSTALSLKGPEYSEEEIEKKTKPLMDEFLHNADFEEAIKCIMELASPSTVICFIYYAINQVLERSSQARYFLGQLLYTLVKKELITVDQYKKGLRGVLENLDDYALDIPLIWDYMGEILEPMYEENKLPLTFLKDVLEPCIPSETAGKLVSAVLHCASKKKGTIKLGELWRDSGLQWTEFLDSNANVSEFIRMHDLNFTVSPTKILPDAELSTDEIRTQLKNLLESTDENEKIFDWIDARVPESAITEPSFIRALAAAVHEHAISGVGSKCELDQIKLKKRIPLLTRYIDHRHNLELHALYAIQQLVNELNQPKGVLRNIFDILYDDDVITEETFKQWEQSTDPNEQEGKSVALHCVRGFFTWLRESEMSGEDIDIEAE